MSLNSHDDSGKLEEIKDVSVSKSIISSSRKDNISHEQTFIFKNDKNYSVGFEEVFKIYKFKLEKLKKFYPIKKSIEKFWLLLTYNFEGEIDKENFINLFKKIYRVILPIFNHIEIPSFIEGEWNLVNKGKNSINYDQFEKYLFNFVHSWTVHISKLEYSSFLDMIYSRIVKYKKTDSAGKIVEILPKFKVKIFQTKTNDDYNESTWESCQPDEKEDSPNYNYSEIENEQNDDDSDIPLPKYKRPNLSYGYLKEDYIVLYNEEVYYDEDSEVKKKLESLEILEAILMKDEDIVIFGYPTQYILMFFKNRLPLMMTMIESGEMEKEYNFKITDHSFYEKFFFSLEIEDIEAIKLLSDALINNKTILLSRDIFSVLNLADFGQDFIDDELNLYNNTRINYQIDRKITIQEVKNHLILDPSFKKALENVIKDDKIGLKSDLWTEKLHKKYKFIIEAKFSLIYRKLCHLITNIGIFSSIIEIISEDIKNEYQDKVANNDIENNFFKQFESKEMIIKDKFDSDIDIIDEANKKSSIILVMGPPMMGKSSICKKLAEDLNMVYLNPLNFLDLIFQKVTKFEEDLANSGEDQQDQDDGESTNKAKNPKKGPESVLSELEFDIYTQLINGQQISDQNLTALNTTIIHSELSQSRGLIIEHNSAIFPENESFTELLLTGFYGNVELDYIIDLTMPEQEINMRKQTIKFNLKTTNIITKRDIELMLKPKKVKKIIYEDEENDEEPPEEGNVDEQPIELSDEDKEKIPKESDLLDILDFENIYNEKINYYYIIQIPIYSAYIKKLKKNYYIKLDITGFDFDDAAENLKKRLNFSFPERPIAKPLEPADYKELLLSGREGILPFRRWSLWKTIDPVSLKDDFLILNGSTEFAADFMCRLFLFTNEENRKKFLENPKKYLCNPPEVPKNYRVAIFGPPKSGKNTVAKILNNLYGWKRVSIEEIYDHTRDYQKSLEEPEPNNVYSHKIHFSAQEWKELTTTNKKEKKPETFYSKIIFLLDYLGIPLDKKKTFTQYKDQILYHEEKLHHLLNPPKRQRKLSQEEIPDLDMDNINNNPEDGNIENQENLEMNYNEFENNKNQTNLENNFTVEKKNLQNLQNTENFEDNNNINNPEIIMNGENLQMENPEEIQLEEEEPYEDPFPPEDDYLIDDLRTDDFYYRFNKDGTYPRPGGFMLMSHPINEEEINKFADFNIVFDKIIYLVDQSEEPLRALMTRKVHNFETLTEEKQAIELEKTKLEVTKVEEIINLLKEKYIKNTEDPIIEVNCADSQENIRSKLELVLNPFYVRIDNEEKSYGNADISEEKVPINKGEFGIFCPVTYKEENWLYYCLEEFETQVNHRKYRFASEKELELFKKNPLKYINLQVDWSFDKRLAPVKVPPPHIYITGYQGSGITTLLNLLVKEFRLKKREIKREFMLIWEDQRFKRKSVRVQKKREELNKQKEDQEAEKKAARESNPDAQEQEAEEMNIEELLNTDAQLDEEEDGFNSVENDKNIFKSLYDPFSSSLYDSSWFEMNEKITTQFMEFMVESRKVPNVFVFIKVNLKTILERHLNIKQIKDYHEILETKSKNKKLEAVEKLKREKREEKYNELKEQLGNDEQVNADEIEEGSEPKLKELPPIESIEIELSEEDIKGIMDEADPDLPELQTLIDAEKDRLVKRFEDNTNFLNDFIEQLKAKLIPVVEISNDNNLENVYKNILYNLNPYLKNRVNLIEKQLINVNFPDLTIRKMKELYSSQIYRLSSYKDYSPVNPQILIKSVEHPLVYRDRLYFFNSLEERNLFAEEPLNYRSGNEFPLDVFKFCMNSLIYVIGNLQSGKTSISRILEEKGFLRLTLKKAVIDLVDENNLKSSILRDDILSTLSRGNSIDDMLAIRIMQKRLELQDCINRNIVIDGFPFTLSQVGATLTDTNTILKPSFVFVCQAPERIIIERARRQKAFKSLIPVITERLRNSSENLVDIVKAFKNKDVDLRYLDTTKSFWFLKDQIVNLIETKRNNNIKFASAYNYDKPGNLNGIAPYNLLRFIMEKNKTDILNFYSPVAMKINNEFNYNKYINFQNNNNITFYQGIYSFLKNEEEFKNFEKNPKLFSHFIKEIKNDIKPVKFLKMIDLAQKLTNEKIFEYQSCCPVSYNHDRVLKDGKTIYSVEYKNKIFKCENAEKLIKFSLRPENYNNIKVKVKTIDDNIIYTENQVNFENTVNYLETNFGSFITKGMLELSNNRIKYPFLSVKETSIKYLALFLKANNPNNNEYARKKYSKKLDEFLKNAILPYDLLNVYENHNVVSGEENKLKKDLIRNQLNNLSEKYDDLMEKAKIQKNTRFDNFFKN